MILQELHLKISSIKILYNAQSECQKNERRIFSYYNFFALILNEFDTTDTDDIAIAKPAKTGESSQPKTG